jgi:hypothetical protein
MWHIDPLLGNDSVNTSCGNECAKTEDIHCYEMDVISVWSDTKLYNEEPAITDSSVGGVLLSEIESVQLKIVICGML